MKAVKRDHPRVRIVAFDPSNWSGGGRDERMAAILNKALEDMPSARTLILTGNLHAKRTRGFTGDSNFNAMVNHLLVKNTAFAFRASQGTYWACTDSCGVEELERNSDAAAVVLVNLAAPAGSINYDGLIDLGQVTASPPAVHGAGAER